MSHYVTTLLILTTCFLAVASLPAKQEKEMVQMAQTMVLQAITWARSSAHDETSLIFGHHRRHHGGKGGGGHDNISYDNTLNQHDHGDHSESQEDSNTDESSLIFGRHRHHRRHHGGKGGGKGGGGGGDHDNISYDNTLNQHGRGAHPAESHEDSTPDESSLIFGRHRHHRRHHGGKGGGGGGGHDNTLNQLGRGGHEDSNTDESSLFFGHHHHHHGGHDDLSSNDTLNLHGQGDHEDSTVDESLFFGHHHHHHGGHDDLSYNDTMNLHGQGGHDASKYNNTLFVGDNGHHGGGSRGRGGHHGGHDDDSKYNNTLFVGDNGHHGGGGRGRGGHHGGHDVDSKYNNTLFVGDNGHHGGGGRGRGGHHGGHDGAPLDLTYNTTFNNIDNFTYQRVALSDCAKLYDQAEPLLARLVENDGTYTDEDANAWLSNALTSHTTCLDGLRERGLDENLHPLSQNLTMVINEALNLHARKQKVGRKGAQWKRKGEQYGRLLASWNPATSKADIVVAKDGSGKYRTIKEAVDALVRIKGKGAKRVVVHVKAGVYNENVEIGRNLRNVMFVGDGIDRTVVTGRRNFIDGDSTVSSATFRVLGDEFWARDMTFENTAGPRKHQAVALMVASDYSLFYRCSIKGYQDSLYAHSLRQFYRDCKIYGTVDFIFGNAAMVFQNCDILVRRPMNHQANMITAQGRQNPNENTGISIHGSRIRPAPELVPVKGSFKTFLGRPWKKYSRTIVAKTDLDGLIHPRGWTEWSGKFALSTLYYAEYMNTGAGASTKARVNWPGFHVLRSPKQVVPFTVRNFIQGEAWIMRTGVPVWTEI